MFDDGIDGVIPTSTGGTWLGPDGALEPPSPAPGQA
jgi:hypothetical protein